MTSNDKHLDKVLSAQRFKEGDSELATLRAHRKKVEALLCDAFGSQLTIRYGGSKAKGTMIRDCYDLDILSYVEHGSTSAGDTLKDIFQNTETALQGSYKVQAKKSALRLRSSEGVDFHIDVVPGRFTDDAKGDVFLYQNGANKERLKTNPDKHIEHVQKSGHADVISILKLLSYTYSLGVRTFVLEIAVIESLAKSKTSDLTERVEEVLVGFRDNIDSLSVEDPANSNNDLSELWNESTRDELRQTSEQVLEIVKDRGWPAILSVPAAKASDAAIKEVVRKVGGGTKPWSRVA